MLQQSTLPKVFEVFGAKEYKAQEKRLELSETESVYFRTSTDPDSAEGIPDCVFAWIDEAGKCSRQFAINIRARVARRQGKVLYTTTPYSLGWFWKEVVLPAQRGERPDIALIQFSSVDNPAFPKEEFERQKTLLDDRTFRRKYLGVHERMEGLVFEDFGDKNWADERVFHPNTQYYGGIDYGFDHPLAITIRAIPGDGNMYTCNVFKKSGLTVGQQIDLIKAKHDMFHVKHWFCGHDRPDITQELRTRGIPISSYLEINPKYKEVNAGNQLHAELIRSGKYKIIKEIHQWQDLEDEYQTYAWDREDEYTARERPIAVDDDLMSAERYCTIGIMTFGVMKEKIVIPDNPFAVRDHFDPRKGQKERHWTDS